ncbi:putative ankyrin repeat protein RF_1099 [Liolophura sinensis]|uniref:putative ankyrin repeat protein RF_1099 n=1 Tax=Liolophura sinensis TaxID=3198878 RepID=UPI00315880CB
MSANASVLEDLQSQLEVAHIPFENLSTLVQTGDERLVEEFLTENIKVEGSGTQLLQSQLYIASFWGMKDIVKELLNRGAAPNHQNKRTLWTPLHAATFQEHGPVVMVLLEHGADPQVKDFEGRSPKDFASASEKIWPHFAALGLQRTSKQQLIDKGVIRKISLPSQSYTGGHYRLTSYDRPESTYAFYEDSSLAAAVNGDVLADDEQGKQPTQQPQFMMWR